MPTSKLTIRLIIGVVALEGIAPGIDNRVPNLPGIAIVSHRLVVWRGRDVAKEHSALDCEGRRRG